MHVGSFVQRSICCAILTCSFAFGSTPTTTSLAVSPASPVSFGSVVTFSATVAAGAVQVHPGLVLFCESTAVTCSEVTAFGRAQLTSTGSATFAMKMSEGSHDVKAMFVGTHSYASSSSSPQGFAVVNSTQVSTSNVLTYGASSIVPYLLSATLSNRGPTGATGSMNFVDDTTGNLLASDPLGSPGISSSQTRTIPYPPAVPQSPATCICPLGGVVATDFRTSGVPDVAAITTATSQLYIFMNDGTGTLRENPPVDIPSQPVLLATGDLNGDGHPDLLVVGADGLVLPLLGSGRGSFSAAASTSTITGYGISLVVEDFDGDGILDLVISNSHGTLTLLRGVGDGTFMVQTASTGATGDFLAVGDFNGDGQADLAASSVSGGSASRGVDILLGNGDGTFTLSNVIDSGIVSGPPVVGDFNADGKADLAIPVASEQRILILLGKGDGTFETPTSIIYGYSGSFSSYLALGDFNGDGKPDLLDSDGALGVLLGNGDGTFVPYFFWDVAGPKQPVAVANFDSHGLSGAFSIDRQGGSPSVINPALTSTAVSPPLFPPGDITARAIYPGDANHLGSHSGTIIVPGTPVNFIHGFAGAASQLALNGATINGTALRLTDGGISERHSAFFPKRVPIANFRTWFDFQLKGATTPAPDADGFAFVITSTGPDALGSAGGGLGYGPSSLSQSGKMIANSVAVKFDLHNNDGEGSSSMGFYTNGASPTTPAIDLLPFGIDLHSGHLFHVEIRGGSVTITDQNTGAGISFGPFPIDTALGNIAYVGFTASTGGLTAVQDILDWGFQTFEAASDPLFDYPSFTDSSLFTFNGGSSLSGAALELTNGSSFSKSSIFSKQRVPIDVFAVDFDFRISAGVSDGFAFVLQNEGPNALGSAGGGLGYGTDSPGRAGAQITDSVAVKFDLHDNAGEGVNSTGVYVDGASPTIPATDLAGSGIDLHSGDPFHAQIIYDGSAFRVSLTDLSDFAVFSQTYQVNVPTVIGAAKAYAGFTAGTGALSGNVKILNWSMTHNFAY